MRKVEPYILSVLILAGSMGWLLTMGREPICTCGHVRLWHGQTDAESYQHLTDWTTPAHIFQGLLLHAALWPVARLLDIGWRLSIVTAVAVAWKIIENSGEAIHRYQTLTGSFTYFGDSVVHATADILAIWLGFWLARVLPVPASVALVVVVVAATALVLQVPPDLLRDWLAGS